MLPELAGRHFCVSFADPRDIEGDVAIVLLAGPLGYVADALLATHGLLSPTSVGACSASAALGLKKAVDSYRTRRTVKTARSKSELADRASRFQSAINRARHSLILEQGDATSMLSRALRTLDEDLSVSRNELLSDEDFNSTLTEAIASYRAWLHDRPLHERRGETHLSSANLALSPRSLHGNDSADTKASRRLQKPVPRPPVIAHANLSPQARDNLPYHDTRVVGKSRPFDPQ